MTEPTLEDDLTALRSFAESLAEDHEREATLGAALDRVSAALRDRAHLEYGCAIAAAHLEMAAACGPVTGDWYSWLKAERARRQGTDGK